MRALTEKTGSRANEIKHYRRKYYIKQRVGQVVARWMYWYCPFLVPLVSVFGLKVLG